MRYLKHNEALINLGKLEKSWLQSTLHDLNALHPTIAVADFKTFASNKKVKAIWRCDYQGNNFHIIFMVEKEEYGTPIIEDIVGRNQVKVLFYVGNIPVSAINATTKNYKTEITVDDIVNKLAYCLIEQEENNNYNNSMQTFYNQLTPTDIDEILVDLTDIIGTKPSIDHYDLQYDIEYDIESFNMVLSDSLEIEPDDNYLKFVKVLNDINHKLKDGYDSAMYFKFDKYYQCLTLKIEYKRT